MLKRTKLFEYHIKASAKMVEFAGWEMPVHYGSIIDEVKATREKAGIFDVSHMGEIRIRGKDAEGFLEKMLPRKIRGQDIGKAIYSFLLNEDGGFIDDLIVYKLAEDDFLICVNAVNTERDYEYLLSHKEGDVKVENVSENYSLLSVQGPQAEEVCVKISGIDALRDIPFYSFYTVEKGDNPFIIARTGYTGEDGFEFFYPKDDVGNLWERFIKEGVKPCGLGARDTLRIEACYPLYGHELREDVTPLEAGMERFIAKDKEFIGKEGAFKKEKELIFFKVNGKSVPRSGMAIVNDKGTVGEVTSGTFSPTLNTSIGIGFIKTGCYSEHLFIDVRGKKLEIERVKPPFVPYRVKRGGKK